MIGETISHYKILEKLGEGGMGVVYKAEDIRLKRSVAIKFFSPQALGGEEEKARFILEARAAAALDHPNICTVHEIDEVEGKTFIVMAYIDGYNLHETLEMGPLSVNDALDTAIEIAEGLQHAHEKGIVHRDIKLSNIMITGRGQAKITDFGLAKLMGHTSITETGTILGTVDYMSPEQARGEPVDHRTDIWSLGVVLYMTLTAELPFKGATSQAVIYSIMNEDPLQMAHWQPAVPVSLEQAVRKMMHKDPLKRYEDMGALIRDLQSIRKDPAAALVSEELAGPFITRRTPFVGRENEREELRRYLNRAKGGNGVLLMLGGEPGVGKTRMTEELEAEANRYGFLTLTGHCYEMEGAPPYIPFVEIIESAARTITPEGLLNSLGDAAPEAAKLVPQLRQRFPEIPQPQQLPPEQERRFLLNNLMDFFERLALDRPILLVLEDLHWADDSTLLLLGHMAQQIHEIPVLIIATYRQTELDMAPSLAKTLEELNRRRLIHEIMLKPLPQMDVTSMLRARSGQEPPSRLVAIIYRETEGNPFFVEEVFKHLAESGKLFDEDGRWRSEVKLGEEEVPRSVLLVIGRRLERVSGQCRQTLSAAAVIGRTFEFELVRGLVEINEDALLDALDEAEQGQLVSSESIDGNVRFIFYHELIRQTLVSELSSLRRQRLHARIADAMERLYADAVEEHSARLAHHLLQAGSSADRGKTLHYLTLAGDRALSASAFEDALRLFDNALTLISKHDRQGRADLLHKRGLALRSLGQGSQAIESWQEALTIYEELESEEAIGQICIVLSDTLLMDANLFEAYGDVERGLDALGDRISASRSRLLAGSAFMSCFIPGGSYQEAHNLFNRAIAVAQKLEGEEVLGPILHMKAQWHNCYWQAQEQVETGRRGCELLRAARNVYEAADSLASAEWGLTVLGHVDEAKKIREEVESLAVRSGNETARWMVRGTGSIRELITEGDLARAEESFGEHLEYTQSATLQLLLSLAYSNLGKPQFWGGNWGDAEKNFRAGADTEFPGPIFGSSLGPLFRFLAYAGEKETALGMLPQMKELMPQPGQPSSVGAWVLLESAVEGLATLGEWDEAAGLYPSALEAVATGNVIYWSNNNLVQAIAGIAAMAGHQWDKAEEHYKIALRQAHEMPFKIEQPEVRRWYARMLIERNTAGDKEKARTLLNEAIAMYREIGMPKHLEMAEELLKGL